MTYEQCLSAINDRQKFSPKPGLERIARLMRLLGDPQDRLRCIHVTGTNGKGSVCAMTASILQKAGYRTGLFTSPYLVDFRERFQINGRMIPEQDLCRWTQTVLAAQAQLEAQEFEPINSFELMTAIAFCWFAEQNTDYVVLEVGLGGRCDPTNVIQRPAVACITSISFDHTAQLGDTIIQIATEKAGIIKPGCMVVTPCTQAPDALRTTRYTCVHRGAGLRVTALPEILRSDADGTWMRYRGGLELHVPLIGAHQTENAACAVELCRLLEIRDEIIEAGIAACRWPGRLQLLQTDPAILIDSAHNPGGMHTLCTTLDTVFRGRPITAIMGMMKDKDYVDCIRQLASRSRRFIGTSVDSPRALDPSVMATVAARACSDAYAVPQLEQAVAMALRDLEPNGILVIGGSVYLAGQALALLG
jgi:dihydrofolate synthase/folylpolyglutamate synthase